MLKAFSFGGGVQSTAALVLAAQGRLDYRTFLFCNVGDDSENPETLSYVYEVAQPFAVRHGLDLVELRKVRRVAALANWTVDRQELHARLDVWDQVLAILREEVCVWMAECRK